MGVVYQAVQTLMDRDVAIKVMNPDVLRHPDALPRFRAEVMAAARLDHPNIVRAHDAEQVGNLHLLVMEFIEGHSLAQFVERKGPLPVDQACRYMCQALFGLQHAFERGLAHRDIKPQNLMVTPKGQVKILDFGLARLRKAGNERRLTEMGSFMGTPAYVAPEQAADAAKADTRADIYSLGCTLYFLLTGRPPFVEDTLEELVLAHVEKEPPPLRELRADVPAELSAVVGRMLAKDPTQRYQTPIEAARAMAPFSKTGPKPGPQPVVPSAPAGVSSPGRGTIPPSDTPPLRAIPAGIRGLADEPPGPPSRRKLLAVLSAAVVVSLAVILLVVILVKIPVPPAADPGNGPPGAAGNPAQPAKAPFVILEIEQPDAEVLVDGQKIQVIVPGDSKPVEIRVPPNKCKLEVKKGGFLAYTREVEVAPGKPDPIKVRLEPVPLETFIVLEVDQPGAEVSIDGKKVTVDIPGDNKPVRIKTEPGRHTVRTRKDGLGDDTQEVEVKAGKAETVKVQLIKIDPKLRHAYRTFPGDWRIEGDELVQTLLVEGGELVFGDFTWKDYDFSARVKEVSDGGMISLLYRVTGKGRSEFTISNGPRNATDYAKTVESGKRAGWEWRPGSLQRDRWHRMRVRVRGANCQCFLDGQVVFEYDLDGKDWSMCGAVGIAMSRTAARFDTIEVTDPKGKVLFRGLPELPAAIDQSFPVEKTPLASELHCLRGHDAPVHCVVFSRDGSRILSSSNGDCAVYDSHTEKFKRVAGPGTSVRLWDAGTGKQLDFARGEPGNEGGPVFRLTPSPAPGAPSFIGNLAPRRDPPKGDKVLLWEIAGDKLNSHPLFPDSVPFLNALGFSSDGKRILALGEAGCVWEWDLNTRKVVGPFPGKLDARFPVRTAVFAPNRRAALLWQEVDQPHPFAEIDLRTGQTGHPTGRWRFDVEDVTSLVFIDGRRVLSGGSDGTLCLWDTPNASPVHGWSGHQGTVSCLACSPDGRRVLSGGADQMVRLWDWATKKQLAEFRGHAGTIRAVAFSPDGLRAASASTDYTVRLWQLPP
jgi:WD40 repeat protein